MRCRQQAGWQQPSTVAVGAAKTAGIRWREEPCCAPLMGKWYSIASNSNAKIRKIIAKYAMNFAQRHGNC